MANQHRRALPPSVLQAVLEDDTAEIVHLCDGVAAGCCALLACTAEACLVLAVQSAAEGASGASAAADASASSGHAR